MEVIKITEGLFFLNDIAQNRHAQFHTYYYSLRLFSGLTSKTQNLSKETGRNSMLFNCSLAVRRAHHRDVNWPKLAKCGCHIIIDNTDVDANVNTIAIQNITRLT